MDLPIMIHLRLLKTKIHFYPMMWGRRKKKTIELFEHNLLTNHQTNNKALAIQLNG